MTQSPFARSLFTSACIAGAIFTATAMPLALFKTKVINLELQNQPVFTSELQDLAAPYLALSGSFSASVALGIFGLLGWRHSVRKSATSQASQSELMNELMTYKAELERIKFSEARLRAQNLEGFLKPEPIKQDMHPIKGEMLADMPSQVTNATTSKPATLVAQPNQTGELAVQPASVHTPHNGFSVESNGHKTVRHGENHEALDQLLSQLHYLSKQVEELRGGTSDQLAA